MKGIKQYSWIAVWIIFFIYLLMQHNLIWMYIDDYGYASLNYAVTLGTTGNNYSLLDIFRYLYLHYMNWGGRVLYYGFAIFIYHYLGLTGMRVVQSLIILAIFYIIYLTIIEMMDQDLLTKYKVKIRIIISIIVCMLYGVFQIGLSNTGLYWFSASSGYVWPILMVLIASFTLYKLIEKKDSRWWKWGINGLLWLGASFSQEQIAIASFVICIGLFIYGKKVKDIKIKYLGISIIFSLTGLGIMLLAPGNWVRMERSSHMSLWGQICYNIPYLFKYILGENASIFLIVLFICFSIVALWTVDRKCMKNKFITVFLIVYSVITLITASYLMININSYSIMESNIFIKTGTILLVVIGLILLSFYLILRNYILQFIYLISSILCYSSMAVVPAIPNRILIPFILLMFPVLAAILVGLIEVIRNIRFFIVYIPLLVLLINNEIEIYKGYQLNQSLQRTNWKILEESHRSDGSENIDQIKLYKMYNEVCTAPMGYMNEYQWSDKLMCIYFDLPPDTKILWDNPYCIEKVWIDCDSSGKANVDLNGHIAISIIPSLNTGDEKIYLNGLPIDSVHGKGIISFYVTKKDIINGEIRLKIESPSLNILSEEKVVEINE